MNRRAQPTPSRSGGSQAGFTLVEALIAMVILIFGLIAISNLFLVATTSNTSANFSTAATTQASEVMERLKAIPFTALAAAVPAGTAGDLIADTGTIVGCTDDTQDCVVAGNYNTYRSVPGVGNIATHWTITNPSIAGQNVLFITVRSEGQSVLFKGRTTAEFTTFRTCTLASPPCP